jgi:Protein of unknown function (DUF3830)
MTTIQINAGPFEFVGHLELEDAPKTCAAFLNLLPWKQKLLHVRWSGEACWVPLGDMQFDVGFENHTSYPSPGHVLLYAGGYSETEILLPYGGTRFASIVGPLAGNHFLTITAGQVNLRELGSKCLWEGAQTVAFSVLEP